MLNKQTILLVFVIILAAVVLLSMLLLPSPKQKPAPSPSMTFRPVTLPQTVSINNVPFDSEGTNSGVDTESRIVRESKAEITKINPSLPIQEDLKLSTGKTVEVIIPEERLQDTAWTLTVQIFNIDYQVPQDDPTYAVEQSSFKEAAAIIFDLLRQKGVDPSKIIISWGDRAFIQERAEQWLKE